MQLALAISSSHLRRGVCVATLLLIFAAELVHVARVYSANWDEAHHLYDGYNIWTRHDYRVNAEVPPLVKLAAALPLLGMHIKTVPRPDQGRAFQDGRVFLVDNGVDRILFPARMMCMLFTLLLACLVYAAGRELFGAAAGLVGLLLFVFDPLVLAHGTLVSTDVGSACCIFGTVYGFYRYSKAPGVLWLAVAGLAAGLTLVAKFTGILIAPMLLLLAVAEALQARSFPLLWKRLGACAGILLCAWMMVWAFYGFRYKAAPDGLELSPQLKPYILAMPNHKGVSGLNFLARHHLLPEAYIWGLANTKTTEWEYTSYFFGKVYRHGPWQYFPAAFLIKSTLPLLILLTACPLLWFGKRERHVCDVPVGPLYIFSIPVGVYFAVVTASHFDIGARHLMPIYPFLYVLCGLRRRVRCSVDP